MEGHSRDPAPSGLSTVGVDVSIARPQPFDLPDSDRPFAEDTEHASYDPSAVTRYWRVLSQVNLLLEAFAASYSGKTSPVHHFWHTFDIAVTRFGDTRVEHSATTDPVTREAYSRDVISFGFWFGDDSFPQPAFYSYTAPEPPDCLTSRCGPRPLAGSNATAATSHCCATTTPARFRRRAPTSIHGPKRRRTPRIPTGDRY